MILRRKGRSRVEDIRIMNQLFPAADAAAHADGVRDAGAEYLVIAALGFEEDSARRAFERVSADPDDFAAAVRSQHADALRDIGIEPLDDDRLDRHLPPPVEQKGPVRGAPSGHLLFRRVVKMVRKDKSQLYGAYLVLAAAQTEHGTTARALAHMNIDPGELASAARAEIDAINSKESAG